MKTIKTEGIVLRKRSLPNQDLIIDFFSKEKGKLIIFAKGIKKITSRRLPHTQTGNLINTVIYKKDDRLYLQETTLISGFSEIKKNQQKMDDLYFILFVVDRLAPENQKEPLLYNVLKKFLIDLSRTAVNDRLLVTRYLNKLLIILGYLHTEKPLDELRAFIENIIEEKLPTI